MWSSLDRSPGSMASLPRAHVGEGTAILMQTPESVYQPSERHLPGRLEPIDYPAHFEFRIESFLYGVYGDTVFGVIYNTVWRWWGAGAVRG